jgi:hypothetical protein
MKFIYCSQNAYMSGTKHCSTTKRKRSSFHDGKDKNCCSDEIQNAYILSPLLMKKSYQRFKQSELQAAIGRIAQAGIRIE